MSNTQSHKGMDFLSIVSVLNTHDEAQVAFTLSQFADKVWLAETETLRQLIKKLHHDILHIVGVDGIIRLNPISDGFTQDIIEVQLENKMILRINSAVVEKSKNPSATMHTVIKLSMPGGNSKNNLDAIIHWRPNSE